MRYEILSTMYGEPCRGKHRPLESLRRAHRSVPPSRSVPPTRSRHRSRNLHCPHCRRCSFRCMASQI